MGYDIVIVQRCSTQAQFDFLKLCRTVGIKIILDLDDNVWDLPPENPAYEIYKQMRNGFDVCVRMTDVLTVSTRTLAKAVKKNVKTMINLQTGKEIPIVVIDNRIDKQLTSPPVSSDRFIVGWQGSNSHIGDLELISEAINTLSVECPHIDFQLRGSDLPRSFKTAPNVAHKFWTPVSEHLARMPRWGWSIALAPVTSHIFNDSKSPLKMIEAGYCGIPCLASWQRPYDEFTQHDRELKWLLCSGQLNWLPKLRTLINDHAMRTELGQRMQAVVAKHYSLSLTHPHEGWINAIKLAGDI